MLYNNTMRLFEKIRSKSFDWNEFVNVTSVGKPKEKINRALQYASECGLLQLGEGNTRRVFVLTSKMVLKIALDDYGRQQNKKETGAYKKTQSQIVTKVYKNSDNYTWIVSELVRQIKSKDEFYDLTGVDVDDIPYVMFLAIPQKEDVYTSSYNAIMRAKITQKHYDLLKNDFIKDLIVFCKKTKIDVCDINRIAQYGVTTYQRVVLLDYGLG